jgi:hypothetical protein
VITEVVQRWRARRDSYRPAGETIRTLDYEVASMDGPGSDNAAKGFVERHHYSGSFPAARFRFGLYRGAELVGVAVFSQPCRPEVVTNVFPAAAGDAVDLGRFVLLDDVPANGESWFLARAFDLLRHDVAGVVSFSDPMARARADGEVVFGGHVGTVYQASNAVYVGRARADTVRLLPDGRSFPNRAVQKIRKREKGWRYAIAALVAAGAEEPSGDVTAWLEQWLPRVTRKIRHPGNHKYAWALDRALRRRLPASQPYPKITTRA